MVDRKPDRGPPAASSQPEPDGRRFRALAVGASAGGMQALIETLGPLPADFGLPVLIAQHLHPSDGGRLASHLDERLALRVVEAEDKQPAAAGCVHLAPADYHLLVERDGSLALSVDAKVNHSRPSIDVLFDSAARAYGEALIGAVLTGASDDGAAGLAAIERLGGLCLVQDPDGADSPFMPQAALERTPGARVLAPAAMGALLLRLAGGRAAAEPLRDET